MRALTIVCLLLCLVMSSVAIAGPRHGSRRGGNNTAGYIAAAVIVGALLLGGNNTPSCGSYGYGYAPSAPSYGVPGCGTGYNGGYSCLPEPQITGYDQGKHIVNRPYRPGQRLAVWGQWILDTNGARLGRQRIATLEVLSTNGRASWCDQVEGPGSASNDCPVSEVW